MIEHARDASGELEAHARVGAVEIARQPRMRRHPGAVLMRAIEQPVDAPREQRGRERRALRYRHHAPDLLPQPLREVVEAQVGADAFAVGHRQLHHAPQRAARHHDLALPERPRLLGAGALEQGVEEDLEAVGEAEMEHGRRGRAARR